MATPSSILAWRLPWTEEPGGLHSWGLKESDTTERLTTARQSMSQEFLVLEKRLRQALGTAHWAGR